MEPDENAIRWAGIQLGSINPDAVGQAVTCFLAIRDVEYRGDTLLKNLLSTKRVQLLALQDAVLHFLASLPNQEWTVVGCQFLLEAGGRWNAVAVASLLDKVMAQAGDKTLMLAEICWIRSVSPASRALASNAPVMLSSALNDDMLFAAEDYFLYDETRRCVFCWADEWEADQSKEIWRFVPASPSFTDFYILSVYSQEYLIASDVAASETAEGYGEKRAFTWRGGEVPGEGGLWRLVPVDGAFAIYNVAQDTYLISPPASGSAFRRLVLTSNYRPLDQSWNECHKWGIKPAAPSLLERGLDAFFEKDYTAATNLFTALLEAGKPSPAASMKVYWYRLVANLRLQKKDFFREDVELLNKLDGCPKYFLDVTKEVLGEDLTAAESVELAQRIHYK
ncbi:Serine/threonine-protein phosphatase 2A regulatory subunit B'' subunit gamma [Phytophthora cinnamomi]|uniref:Serine/threonine-protein phosphatase 2A regulatory subunit B'' subunit gamma n=1 Tax=Phytophthora cinnamomi TaxID=4785 RepID=UPI003559A07E|nr:Serine/threonine-protein phosphatase 2A regulatory subunit B'' subunit gamma [Phytophthora cinnamomi]